MIADVLQWLKADMGYVGLLFVLFVLPKFLQRFGLPSALTALVFGAIAGMFLGVQHDDATIRLLATLGIVALFLFAGLDVELSELKQESTILSEHVLVVVLMLLPAAFAAREIFSLDARAATVVALGLMTPSTGFILDSLASWGLSSREQFWIRSKAIATELVALAAMFIVLQSTEVVHFGLSATALVAMIAVLPWIFRWFAAVVLPHAPRSEFGFLVMIAVACALITRSLGVYYLVGAFVVGLSARQFRKSLPALSSDRMLHAVEALASLFVPFYFFRAGLELTPDLFTLNAVLAGLGFVAFLIPFRLLIVAGHRMVRFRERLPDAVRIGIPLLPTTVFTLVIVDILRERFEAPSAVLGGLIIYMLANTLVPSLILKKPLVGFEEELLRDDGA